MSFILFEDNGRIKIEESKIVLPHGLTAAGAAMSLILGVIGLIGFIMIIANQESLIFIIIFIVIFILGLIGLLYSSKIEMNYIDKSITYYIMLGDKTIKQYKRIPLVGNKLIIRSTTDGEGTSFDMYVQNEKNQEEYHVMGLNSEATSRNFEKIVNARSDCFKVEYID